MPKNLGVKCHDECSLLSKMWIDKYMKREKENEVE